MTVEERTAYVADSPELRAEVARRLRDIQEAVAGLTAELQDAMMMMSQCDGSRDGEPCILARHQGLHRSASGAEWLDD
jgi:hypothetical protein